MRCISSRGGKIPNTMLIATIPRIETDIVNHTTTKNFQNNRRIKDPE
jgi:hypothetical protein